MRIKSITVQDFRNIALAELSLSGARQFFIGENAQGKTNLLEAAGLVSALRSFRTGDERALIAHGKGEAAVACVIEHEKFGESRVVIRLRPGGKEVLCDGERVRRLGDFLGRFPTVVFSSQDLLLVRGAPGGRRRWLDLVLSETDSVYLRALQGYHRALAERNQLLKRGAAAGNAAAVDGELAAFEAPLARAAAELAPRRAAGVSRLGEFVAEAFARIDSDGAEANANTRAGLAYAPSVTAGAQLDAAGWAEVFARGRARDIVMRATLAGPHRDDCELTVGGRVAREFASEGQQRSLAIALRLAEAAFLRERAGVQPVLLADDILGELDPGRRRRFWAGLHADDGAAQGGRQVIATGTSAPDAALGAWQMFAVRGGAFSMYPENEYKPGAGGAA